MNGIYFDINSEGATFVASDGHKLVCSRNSISQLSDRSSFILPKKPASLLKAILAKESDNVSIEFDTLHFDQQKSQCPTNNRADARFFGR